MHGSYGALELQDPHEVQGHLLWDGQCAMGEWTCSSVKERVVMPSEQNLQIFTFAVLALKLD